MAELYTLRPLFPGTSEVDEIFKICQVLGTPKKNDWSEGYQLATSMNFRFPQCVPINLKTLIPNASEEALTLMRDMLHWDPKKRPTASQALRYPYFQVGQALGPPPQLAEQKRPLNKTLQPQELQPALVSKKQSSSPSDTSDKTSADPVPVNQKALQQIQVPQSTHEHQLPSKPQQMIFPSINKTISPKPVANGPQSSAVSVKHGRRRWGQSVLKDSWDEFDADFGISYSKKPSIAPAKENKLDDSLFGLEESVSNANEKKGFSNAGLKRIDSSQTSAKQHYLRQSRYLPGMNPKNIGLVSANKEAKHATWSGALTTKPLGPVAGGLGFNRTNEGTLGGFAGPSYNPIAGYVPSFQKKEVGSAGQRIQLAPIGTTTAPANIDAVKGKLKISKPKSTNQRTLVDNSADYDAWKPKAVRAQLPGLSFKTATGNLSGLNRPQPVHGRTDWTAKYGGHR
ncbi:hypothetical protein GDO86_011255 [Hymenochirus boettgeri]|uniref:Protein kinase domain-containing protein n=1 Tax=Hymenochirus boettgeri TaxID=247094 RepID=A0A8T2JB00_9PIPI|nr:hypothetical protein GDO86_011255 [Hymenochirus boettgeri]